MPAGATAVAPRRPSRRSPTSELDQQDRDEHHDDQHRGIGDGEAELAGLDAADDVGRRHVVLGGDEEDHGADRRHRAHEAVDERGDDRPGAAAAGSTRRRVASERAPSVSEASSRLLVDLAQRRDAGAHADRHVAEHEAHHEDEGGAGELDRRHVEGEDVGDADDGAGDREAQHGAELEGAPAGEALPRQQIGGEQAERGGERRRDRRDLERRRRTSSRPSRRRTGRAAVCSMRKPVR